MSNTKDNTPTQHTPILDQEVSILLPDGWTPDNDPAHHLTQLPLPDSLDAQLQEASEKEGISMGDYIRKLWHTHFYLSDKNV